MNRQRAIDLLTFYIRMAYEHGGLRWDCDNYREIEDLVDALIAAAKEDEQ